MWGSLFTDVLVIYLLISSVFTGKQNGLAYQLTSMFRFILAYLITVTCYDFLNPVLCHSIPLPPSIDNFPLLGKQLSNEINKYHDKFILLFFALAAANCTLFKLEEFIDRILEKYKLYKLDKLGGAITGFIKSYLILNFVFTVLDLFPFLKEASFVENSKLGKIMQNLTPFISEHILKFFS